RPALARKHVRAGGCPQVRCPQDGTCRISPRTFQEPDDRCRNGRKVPFDGAKALARRARRQPTAHCLERREGAASEQPHRGDAGVTIPDRGALSFRSGSKAENEHQMSALPPKAVKQRTSRFVRFVPKCMARPCGTRWTSEINERESCINVSGL